MRRPEEVCGEQGAALPRRRCPDRGPHREEKRPLSGNWNKTLKWIRGLMPQLRTATDNWPRSGKGSGQRVGSFDIRGPRSRIALQVVFPLRGGGAAAVPVEEAVAVVVGEECESAEKCVQNFFLKK